MRPKVENAGQSTDVSRSQSIYKIRKKYSLKGAYQYQTLKKSYTQMLISSLFQMKQIAIICQKSQPTLDNFGTRAPKKSSPELRKSIEKFITCQNPAENMSDWEDYFPNNNFGELNACKANVVGVEFSEAVLPSVRAQAWIPVTILENVNDDDLEEWAKSDSGLQSGITWSWD